MFERWFPDSIFRRKLGEATAKRLRLAQARAEEAVIEVHVRNALLFVDTLAEELPFDRAIDSYIRVMGIPEPLASTVATRTLVVLGEELVPPREEAPAATIDDRPRLRLDDAAAAAADPRRPVRARRGNAE